MSTENYPETVGRFPPAGAVLVVDDDAGFRSETRVALLGAGYSVGEAETADAALTELSHTEYDVVLLEVSMRDASGIDVLRSIRATDLVTTVILVDTEPDIDSVKAGMEWGALNYVPKPVELLRLLELVESGVRLARLAQAKSVGPRT